MTDLQIDKNDTPRRNRGRLVADGQETVADGHGANSNTGGCMVWRDVSALGARWDGVGPTRWRADGPDGSHWLVEQRDGGWAVWVSGFLMPGERRSVQAIRTDTPAQAKAVAESYANNWLSVLRYRLRGMPLPPAAYDPDPREDDDLVDAAVEIIAAIDNRCSIFPGDTAVKALRAAVGRRR